MAYTRERPGGCHRSKSLKMKEKQELSATQWFSSAVEQN